MRNRNITHAIYRNGKYYDRINPDYHRVTQYTLALASDHPGDLFEVQDEHGVVYRSFLSKEEQES